MRTIAFFNNKGGVGKTTLVYHLAWMFSELGFRVVALDFDPQANLTAMTVSSDDIELIEEKEISSIYDVVAPLISRGEDTEPQLIEINSRFALLPGDLQLSSTEDALSAEWTNCLSESLVRERAFLVTTSLARTAQRAGAQWRADLVLIDIGPNLGAINRSALLGADHVIVPVAADIFSLKGLINVGRGLADWRRGWKRRLESPPGFVRRWPSSAMEPLGYIVSRFSIYKGEKSAHFRRWINRVPDTFHREILGEPESPHLTVDEDSSCLAWLKDYRSLMPMAQEVHKPIFKLKPADGAIGGHQQGVSAAYADFEKLAQSIANRVPILVPS